MTTAADERIGAQLVEAFGHFGVEAKVVGGVSGPHVTRYELRLAPGIKMSKVAGMRDDLAYALAADDVRILAPIPGKRAVGVEVPNRVRNMVHLGDVAQASPEGWSPLTAWLGKDIDGRAIGIDLASQPHVLVAGTTGSGKSGCVNAMLTSILMRATPNEVRLVLVDPKQVELNLYEHIPHLVTPVVTSPRLAANVLQNLIREMEERYSLMSGARTRKLEELNRVRVRNGEAPLPYLLCVIDELADLMMIAPGEVEDAIIRLAQKSRAVGIHLVLATQRPSADIITGMIKANVPARIAFAVSSQTDSRVILDQNGAESLLGKGDMLFRPGSGTKLSRIQGAFVTEEEIEKITGHWRKQGEPELREELLEAVEEEPEDGGADADFDPDQDELMAEAIRTVVQMDTASTSMLQRRLRVGYTRAGRLIDMLERRGVISGYEGSKARKVLVTEADLPRVLAALEEPLSSAGVGAGADERRSLGLELRQNAGGDATHRRKPARSANAPGARHRRCRGAHQDPREVPACAGERGVGLAAGPHVRQDVPAHLRRGGGPRPPPAGGRVPRQPPARGRDGARSRWAAPPAATSRAAPAPPAAAARAARARRRCWCWSAWSWWACCWRSACPPTRTIPSGRPESDHHRAPRAEERPAPRKRPRPAGVVLRVTPTDAHLRVRGQRRGHRGGVRGHAGERALVPQPAPASDQPRQALGGHARERAPGADPREPEPDRLRRHARGRAGDRRGHHALRVRGAADGGAGRNRGHGHRGAHRAGSADRNGPWLSDRLMELGRRSRPHHDLRRPPGGHGVPAALPGGPGGGPDRDQRRPRPDGRRPDAGGGGGLRRPPARPGRGARGPHRRRSSSR